MEFQISYKIKIKKELIEELGEVYGVETEEEIAQACTFLIKTVLLSQGSVDAETSDVKVIRVPPRELNQEKKYEKNKIENVSRNN